LTSALDVSDWSISSLCHFTTGERAPGWMGPEPAWTLWRRGESFSCRQLNPKGLVHRSSLYRMRYPSSTI
jgi:hypothetical protein